MIEFKYTKGDGSVSQRVGLVLSKPTKNYMVLDLSDLDTDEIDYVEQRFEEYLSAKKALLDSFKFSPYIKSFKPEGMTECIGL